MKHEAARMPQQCGHLWFDKLTMRWNGLRVCVRSASIPLQDGGDRLTIRWGGLLFDFVW
jgi:hypothetical protein